MADSIDPIATPSFVARLAAILAGLVVLAAGAVVSLGAALLAPVGMLIAAVVLRRRGRVLGRAASWFVAAGSVAVVLLAFAGFVATRVPSGTWRQLRRAQDSATAAAAKQPPPAWIERIAPQAAPASRAKPPAAVQTAAMAWVGGFATVFLASIYGSIGWGAGMLLGFGAAGRWPGAKPIVPATVDAL